MVRKWPWLLVEMPAEACENIATSTIINPHTHGSCCLTAACGLESPQFVYRSAHGRERWGSQYWVVMAKPYLATRALQYSKSPYHPPPPRALRDTQKQAESSAIPAIAWPFGPEDFQTKLFIFFKKRAWIKLFIHFHSFKYLIDHG